MATRRVEGGLNSRKERELTCRECYGALRACIGELIRSLRNPSFLCSPQFVCLQPAAFRASRFFKAVFALNMTFTPISYVYVPTAPRSKSTKSGHKTQHIRLGATTLDTLRPPVAEDADGDGHDESRIQAEMATPDGDEDDNFPTIEEVLYTALQEKSLNHTVNHMGEHGSTANAGGEEEAVFNQRSHASSKSPSVPGDSLGNARDDPIVLGEDDSNISETVESDFRPGSVSARTEEADTNFFSPASTPGSRVSASPCAERSCQNIDTAGFAEKTRNLQFTELVSLPFVSAPAPRQSSRLSSKPLQDSGVVVDLDVGCIQPEPIMACPFRAPSQPPCHPHTIQVVLDKHESAPPTPTIDISSNEEREGASDDNRDDDEPQQAAGYAAEVLARSIEDDTLGQINHDPSPEPSQDKSRGQSGNCRDGELGSDRTMLGRDGRPLIVKRKRQSPYDGGPTQRKRHHWSRQKPTRQLSIHTNSSQRSPKPQSSLDQISTVNSSPSAKTKLSVPRWHIADPELSCDCTVLGRSSSNIPPTLIDITFCPRYLPYSSYRAVIHDTRERRSIPLSQIAQVVESSGPVGMISSLDIHQLKHHFLVVSGVCQPALSQLSSSRMTVLIDTETCSIKNNSTQARPLHQRASRASSQEHQQDSSDDSNLDGSGSGSDSGSDSGSEDDGCSGDDEREQTCLNARKNTRWDEIEEQRLRVYKEEGKPWKWIFKQFPDRTEPAIRMRWIMIQNRSEQDSFKSGREE